MIENEFKALLTRGEYETLLGFYGWDKTVEQTNYYYDTAELMLSDRHITCRVRKIGGDCCLQIKLPTGRDYSRIELEKKLAGDVPAELSAELLNELAGNFAENPLPDVRLLGALSTTRNIKRFEGAEIDLDKSAYFGKTDYELEIEFTDEAAARAVLAQCREAAGLTKSGDVCAGKIRRFLEEYLKNGKNELLSNVRLLHITPMGADRVRRNLGIEGDPVAYCREKIISPEASITREGKNWYIGSENCVITVNASSYTIITAHLK